MTLTFNNCLLTFPKALIGGWAVSDTNTQWEWTPPVFPAWNASDEQWMYLELLEGGNTPPRPGNAPYTGYPKDPWGSDRLDIGALYFGEIAAPVIEEQPQDTTVCENAEAQFQIAASGEELHFQWYRNNEIIAGENTNTTIIPSVALIQDGDKFKCKVWNGGGEVISNEATLTVRGLPHITIQPQNRTVFVGQPVVFTVTATGYALHYEWRRGGTPIPGAPDASSYTLPMTAPGDAAAIFSVRVYNLCSEDVSNNAILTVLNIVVSPEVLLSVFDGKHSKKHDFPVPIPVKLYCRPLSEEVILKTELHPKDDKAYGVNMTAARIWRSKTLNYFYDRGETVYLFITGPVYSGLLSQWVPNYIDVAVEGYLVSDVKKENRPYLFFKRVKVEGINTEVNFEGPQSVGFLARRAHVIYPTKYTYTVEPIR